MLRALHAAHRYHLSRLALVFELGEQKAHREYARAIAQVIEIIEAADKLVTDNDQ